MIVSVVTPNNRILLELSFFVFVKRFNLSIYVNEIYTFKIEEKNSRIQNISFSSISNSNLYQWNVKRFKKSSISIISIFLLIKPQFYPDLCIYRVSICIKVKFKFVYFCIKCKVLVKMYCYIYIVYNFKCSSILFLDRFYYYNTSISTTL